MSVKKTFTFSRILGAVSFSRIKSAVSSTRIKSEATFSRVLLAASFSRAKVSDAVLGLFIKILRFGDSASVSDQETKSFAKGTSDSASTNDDQRKGVSKILEDISTFAESVVAIITKALTDSASADDDTQVGFNKSVSDTFTASDTIQPFQFGKNLDDTVRATDDVGGEASVDDDQTIAFFKVTGDIAGADDNLSRVVSFNRAFSDGSDATDLLSIGFGTSLSDNASSNDDAVISYGKSPAENVGTADNFSRAVGYTRGLTDSTGTDDVFRIRVFGKALSDTSSVADVFVAQVSFSRLLSDKVSATDDVNGAAVDDDQNIQFVKVRSDSSSVGDSELKSLGKDLGDSAGASDSGSFLVQGYVADPTYFADDYVGTTGSF